MLRPTFHWLLGAAAIAGVVSGLLSGRQTGGARIVEAPGAVQTRDESTVPAQFAPEAAPQSTGLVEKDLATIAAMRSPSRRESALLTLADSLDTTSIEAARECCG